MSSSTKNNGAGRPTKFKQEYIEQVEKLCMLGATKENIAYFFGVCVKTVDNWMREEPRFLRAINSSRLKYDAEVGKSLFNKATGYTRKVQKPVSTKDGVKIVEYEEYFPPNATSQIFWLKNRQPQLWRAKPNIEDDDSNNALNKLCDAIVKATE